MSKNLRKTQTIIKDLILFDRSWKKRKELGEEINLSKQALERIGTYRDLVRNSFLDLLSRIYPYSKKLIGKEWERLLSEYFEFFPPKSPVLNKIAENFPLFLSHQEKVLKKYPFIHELAMYEWLELEIADKENRSIKKGKLNPIHVLFSSNYPVHKTIEYIDNNADLNKLEPIETHIIIYRDPRTHQVRFFELSKASLAYIELFKQGFDNESIVEALATAYKIDLKNFGKFKKEINKFIKALKKNKIIL
jgi:hypothetical protein